MNERKKGTKKEQNTSIEQKEGKKETAKYTKKEVQTKRTNQ